MKGNKTIKWMIILILILLFNPTYVSAVGENTSKENETLYDTTDIEEEKSKYIVLFRDKVSESLITDAKGTVEHNFENIPALEVTLPVQSIQGLINNPNVLSVEKNEQFEFQSQTVDWGHKHVKTHQAWSTNYTGKGVKVAVIDSGIDKNHEDLKISGCFSASDAATCSDDEGHGTHVTGIIGALDNDIGIAGVAPNADIYSARVSNLNGEIWANDVLTAVDWAISENVDIINISLGTRRYSPSFDNAVTKAFKEGIIVVAAAGNDDHGTVRYPAALPNVIAVSAVTEDNKTADFSNIGNEIDFSAPGDVILSTYIGNTYVGMSGTSMAAPFVTGVIALLKEAYPEADQNKLKDILKNLSLDLGEKGKDNLFGYGLIQAPDKTLKLQIDLKELGFLSGSISGLLNSETESAVRDFQKYYGLTLNGKTDEVTVNKIQDILSSPFRNGSYHKDTILLKEKLASLGFPVSATPTTYYGPSTARVVKDFQNHYGLRAHGIADSVTWNKINSLLTVSLELGTSHAEVIVLKENLALLGFSVSTVPTAYYGGLTEKTVKEFQSYYSLPVTGKSDKTTTDKITELLSSSFRNGRYHNETILLKENLAELGFSVSAVPTTYYGPSTERVVKEFQKQHGLRVSGIADSVTWNKINSLLTVPMEVGTRNNEVLKLKENLALLGFYISASPTTFYGSVTEQTVKDFQSYYSLSITGKGDRATTDKITEILSSPLRNGESHTDSITLKQNLAALGFPVSATPTTYFGPSTERVVKEFQNYHDLRVNGIADSVTLNKINNLLTQ